MKWAAHSNSCCPLEWVNWLGQFESYIFTHHWTDLSSWDHLKFAICRQIECIIEWPASSCANESSEIESNLNHFRYLNSSNDSNLVMKSNESEKELKIPSFIEYKEHNKSLFCAHQKFHSSIVRTIHGVTNQHRKRGKDITKHDRCSDRNISTWSQYLNPC